MLVDLSVTIKQVTVPVAIMQFDVFGAHMQVVTVSTPKWGQVTMTYQTDCLLLINMYKSL